jgi:O-antigen/teichoic acid export membrane protein
VTEPTRRDRPGGQVGRTRLAWERSTFGLFATGAVLLLRHAGTLPLGPALVAAVAVALGLLCLVLGRRRARRIWTLRVADSGRAWVPDARQEVRLLGYGVAAVAAAAVLVMLLR